MLSDDIARKKSMPMSRSAIEMPGENGTTAKARRTAVIMTAGARTNTALSEKGGTQSSFANILSMSATTCRRPNGPTRLGPYLSCHRARRRLSIQMRPALMVVRDTSIAIIMTSGVITPCICPLRSGGLLLCPRKDAPRRERHRCHARQKGNCRNALSEPADEERRKAKGLACGPDDYLVPLLDLKPFGVLFGYCDKRLFLKASQRGRKDAQLF